MSAPISGEQFHEVHRGLTGKLNPNKPLGMHWSSSKDVAIHFARGQVKNEDPNNIPSGTILHAQIPMSSVETNASTLRSKYVINPETNKDYSWEQEVPAKSGSKVLVTGITKLKSKADELGRQRTRTRTYNPPREMKA